jgi:DNA-binding transcriptional LysR family regulator
MIEGHARASGKRVQRITLAGPSSMMRGRIIPACVLLGQQQTQLRFSFQIDDSVEAVKEKLRRGAVHFGILPQGAIPAELEHKSLSPEAYILAVPWSWRKRGLAEIVKSETMIDFDEQDVITQQYLQGLGLFHLARLERHFANNTDALAAMVVGGLGYSLLARDMARSLLEEKLIASKGEASALVFALCWYRRPVMPSHWEDLVNRLC